MSPLACLLVACCTFVGSAGASSLNREIFEDDHTRIVATQLMDVPETGFTPVQLEMTNKSGQAEMFRLGLGYESLPGYSGASSYRRDIKGKLDWEVPAHQTLTKTVLVPLRNPFRSFMEQDKFVVFGAGNAELRRLDLENQHFSSLQLLRGEATSSWGDVDQSFFSSVCNPAQLLPDWRQFCGFSGVVFTPQEISALSPSQRESLRDYVRFGGQLTVATVGPGGEKAFTPEFRELICGEVIPEDENLAVFSQGEEVARFHLGLGKIRLVTLGEQGGGFGEIEDSRSYQPILSAVVQLGSRYPRWGGGVSSAEALRPWSWAQNMLDKFEASRDKLREICLFLLIPYLIVVGPVNFMLLAPRGRRARLLVTTPLISLAASLLLVVFIYVQDGFGGEGRAMMWVECQPNRKLITQFQNSRQGVMMETGINVPGQAMVTPVSTSVQVDDVSMDMEADGFASAGAWFATRSNASYLVQTVVPTRGGLEVQSGGGEYKASSTLSDRLCAVLYTPDGKSWYAGENLETGGRVTLKPVVVDAPVCKVMEQGLKYFPDAYGERLKKMLQSSPSGTWIAYSADARALETNPSVKLDAQAIFTGVIR